MYTSGCRIGDIVYSIEEVYFNIQAEIWLLRYLNERHDKDPALFVTERAPLGVSIVQTLHINKMVSLGSKFNKKISPHQLRHSYSTHLIDNRAPLEVIQSLLGHEKNETTRKYAKLSGKQRLDHIS